MYSSNKAANLILKQDEYKKPKYQNKSTNATSAKKIENHKDAAVHLGQLQNIIWMPQNIMKKETPKGRLLNVIVKLARALIRQLVKQVQSAKRIFSLLRTVKKQISKISFFLNKSEVSP